MTQKKERFSTATHIYHPAIVCTKLRKIPFGIFTIHFYPSFNLLNFCQGNLRASLEFGFICWLGIFKLQCVIILMLHTQTDKVLASTRKRFCATYAFLLFCTEQLIV